MPAGHPGKSAKERRRYSRQLYLNKKIEMLKAAGVGDVQVEYKNNGEIKEVYYYKKVAVNEEQEGEQPEAVKEVRVPLHGLKQKAPQKYKKPKIQPKNPVVALRHEWKEAISNGDVIRCPNYKQCQFQATSAADMEYHYLKCIQNATIYTCACGKFYTKKSSFIGHKYLCGQAFKCQVCGKAFFNRRSLLNHIMQCQQDSATAKKMIGLGAESLTEACDICSDVFVNKEDLLHHLSVMHPGQEVTSTPVNVTRHTEGLVPIKKKFIVPQIPLGKRVPVLAGQQYAALKQEWQEKNDADELIECPNYKQCFFSCYTVTRMERHYINCGRGFEYFCPCGRFFHMKYSYVKHQCPCNKVLYCEQCDKQYYSRNGYEFQIGKRSYSYCETCGEGYANHLDDYDPEDFVTLLSDNRVSLRFVPQEGDNSVSNETTLHEDIDEDVTSLPDVDDPEEFISLNSSPAPVHPAVTSTVEDGGSLPAGHRDVDPSSSPPTTSSLITVPSQPVSSCDVTVEDTEDSTGVCDAVQNNTSLKECSEPINSATSDVSLESHPDRCSSDVIALQEVTVGSPHPTDNKGSQNNISTSHMLDVTIIADTTSPPPSVIAYGVTNSSSSDVTTPLQVVGGDKEPASNTTGATMATEGEKDGSDVTMATEGKKDGSDGCTSTLAKDVEPNRAPLTDKDEIKVIIDKAALYKKWRKDLREKGYTKCPNFKQCNRQFRSLSGMRYHYAHCGSITCSICKRTFTAMSKFHAHHVLFHDNLSSKSSADVMGSKDGVSTAVRGQSTPDLGEKFLKDLKSVKDRSGPLPLWLSKASHYSRGDVTDGTPMAALEIQSQDSDSEDELVASLASNATPTSSKQSNSSTAVEPPATLGATPTALESPATVGATPTAIGPPKTVRATPTAVVPPKPKGATPIAPESVGATPTASTAGVDVDRDDEITDQNPDGMQGKKGEGLAEQSTSNGAMKETRKGVSAEGIVERNRKRELTADDKEKNKKLKLSNSKSYTTGDGMLYRCKTCDKTYNSLSSLYNHMEVCNKVLLCKICGRQYHSRSGLSNHEFICTLVGGLPSFYCDICGKVYTSRDELVTHHSSVHSDSPALAGQPQETNRSSGGDSAIQEDGSALVPDNEDGESESGEKSETIADNAAQRTGSLNGTLERDRRKLEMKLLLSYWRAELRLHGYVRCPMYKYCGCHCSTLNGMKYHYPRCGTIACPRCEKTFTTIGRFHTHFLRTHYNHFDEIKKKKKKDEKTQDEIAVDKEFGNCRRVLPFPQIFDELHQKTMENKSNSVEASAITNAIGAIGATGGTCLSGDVNCSQPQHRPATARSLQEMTPLAGFPSLVATFPMPMNRIVKEGVAPVAAAADNPPSIPAKDKERSDQRQKSKLRLTRRQWKLRRREIALRVFGASRKKAMQEKGVYSTSTSSVVDNTSTAVEGNAPLANVRYQTRGVKRRLQQEEQAHKEDERIPAALNLGYKNLHSLITAAAAVASASRETPLTSVLSLARAVRQKVTRDATLEQQVGNTAAQHKRLKTAKNSLTGWQATSRGVRTISQSNAASQTTPKSSTIVRVSLFRAVQCQTDQTGQESTTVDQVSEDHSLVAMQQAQHVVTHLLNDVMNKLTKDNQPTSSVQPCSQTHQPAQAPRDIPPPVRKPPSNSKKSNSRPTSTLDDHPAFTPDDYPVFTPDDQPTPDDQSTPDDQPTPDDGSSSIVHQKAVSTTPTVSPVTSEAPTNTQANIQCSTAPISFSADSAVFYTRILYDRLLQQNFASSSQFMPVTSTVTTTASLPVTMTTSASNIVKLPSKPTKATGGVAKVTNVTKVTSTSKVTNDGAAERNRRKSNEPRRTSQSVLDMERAPPYSCYGNANPAAMRSTSIFSSNDLTLHHLIPHMIPDNNHIPEVNFSYRQSVRQLPICQIVVPTALDDGLAAVVAP